MVTAAGSDGDHEAESADYGSTNVQMKFTYLNKLSLIRK